jgi:hypothetical protein
MRASIDWVTDVVKAAGVTRSYAEAHRLRYSVPGYQIANRRDDLPTEHIAQLYKAGGTATEIGERFGVSRSVIQRIASRAGVPLRSASDTQRLIRRKKAIAIAKSRPDHTGWGEDVLQEWLAQRGEVADAQTPVGVRNLDLAIHPVAVEVWLSSSFPFNEPYCRERIKYLSDAGWSCVYVLVSRRTRTLLPIVADEVVRIAQLARRDPTAARQHWVIRGCGELAAIGSAHLDHIARIPASKDCPHHSCVNKRVRR